MSYDSDCNDSVLVLWCIKGERCDQHKAPIHNLYYILFLSILTTHLQPPPTGESPARSFPWLQISRRFWWSSTFAIKRVPRYNNNNNWAVSNWVRCGLFQYNKSLISIFMTRRETLLQRRLLLFLLLHGDLKEPLWYSCSSSTEVLRYFTRVNTKV